LSARSPLRLLVLSLALGGLSGSLTATQPSTVVSPANPERPLSLGTLLVRINERLVSVAGDRKLRLAVIPLRGTESPRYADKGFGAFLTEKITSSLGSPESSIRLFERSRLDAVLQEQKLSASGLFDESEARRLGELAPLDAILTGSFTRMDRSVAVQLRIIDVVTGEVRGQISENVELTSELASLFLDLQAAPPEFRKEGRAPSPCEPRWVPVRKAMEDIGSPEKLDLLMDQALAILFEPPCGDIHFEVIAHLVRHKQQPARYGPFLLKTLQGIQEPDGDDRDRQIARYLLVPGQLEDPAWEALLRLAQRSRQTNVYLDWLLADKVGTKASRQRLNARIGILLREMDQKKLGKPLPLDPRKGFADILVRLRHAFLGGYGDRQDLQPLIDGYRTYGTRYAGDSNKQVLETLVAMHEAAKGPERDEILGWIGDRVNHFTPSRELEGAIVRFVDRLIEARTQARKKDPSGGVPAQELKRLATLCGTRLAQTIPFTLGRDYRLNLTGLCLEHGIQAEGIVPTVESLTRQLGSEEDTEQREAIRLLKALGPRALPAEPLALKKLRRLSHQSSYGANRYLQHDLLELLGTLQTRSPEGIQLLVSHLGHLESYLADAAIEALVHVGEPAVAVLEAAFPTFEEPYKQIRVLKVFQWRGRAAKAHLPWLRARLEEATSPLVKDALEDAIEAVS